MMHPGPVLLHGSPLAASKHVGGADILPQGGFIPPEEVKFCLGAPQKRAFAGAQVRVPISELKNWLREKLAY